MIAAEDIFGPDLGSIKGKTTRRRPLKVGTEVLNVMLDQNVMRHYKKLRFVIFVAYFGHFLQMVTGFISL